MARQHESECLFFHWKTSKVNTGSLRQESVVPYRGTYFVAGRPAPSLGNDFTFT